MTNYTRTLLLAYVACIALVLASPAAASASSVCPSQVDDVLAGQQYSDCKSALNNNAAWVFTSDNADAIRKSDACSSVLEALEAIPFDVCEASIVSSSSVSPATRVMVDKQVLRQIASSPVSARRLRQAIDGVKRALAEGETTMDYNYLYIGIGVSLAFMLLCCILNRGGVLCCCIPIPLCC